MAAGPLDEAFIKINSDTVGFIDSLDQIHDGLVSVEELGKRVGESLEDSFREAGRAIRETLDALNGDQLRDIGQQAEQTGEQVERAFDEAGRAVVGTMAETSAGADEALSNIGGVGVFGPVVEEAEIAGEAVNAAFRDAAEDSDIQLAEIGGAGAFGPVVVESEVAAEAVEHNFRDASNDSVRALGRIGTAGSGFSLISTGLTAVGFAGAAAAAGITAFGIKSSASLEQTELGFKALLGSADAAGSFIKDLQQFAATTPFEFPGLADNARQILAMGQAAGITKEEVIPLLGTIGDLTAVLGQPPEAIDRVVRALSQMSSKGKISSEELLQISEAVPGFPVFQAMADGLGISTKALQDQLQKGAVPAKEGIAALVQGMKEFPGAAGAMADQAQTLNGVFSTFKDTIGLSLTQAFRPLIPTIKTQLGLAVPAIQDALGTIAPALSSLAGSLLTVVGGIIGEAGPALGVALQGIGDGLSQLTGPFVDALVSLQPAIKSLGGLFAALGPAIAPVISLIGDALGAALPPIVNLLTLLVKAATPLIQVFTQVGERIIGALGPAFAEILRVVGEVAQALAPVLTEIAEILGGALADAVEFLAPILGDVARILGGALLQAFEVMRPAIRELVTVLGDSLQEVLESLAPVLPELAEALGQIAIAFAQLTVALVPLLIPLIRLATILITNIGAPVLLKVAQAIALLATGLANLAGVIGRNVQPILSTLADLFRDLWHNTLVPFGQFLKAEFFAALQTVAQVMADVVSTALNAITTAATFLWQNVLVPLGNFLQAVFVPAVKIVLLVAFLPLLATLEVLIITFTTLWRFVLEPFGSFLVGVLTPVIKVVASILGTVFRAAVQAVIDVASFLWRNVLVPLGAFLSASFKVAVGVAKAAFDALKASVGFVKDVLSTLWHTIGEPLSAFLRTTLKGAVDALKGAFNLLKVPIDAVVSLLKTLRDVAKSVAHAVGSVIDKIKNLPGADKLGDVISKVPGLGAEGGIFDEATPMVIGEAGREVLLPLTDPARTLELAQQSGLFDVLNRAGGFRTPTPAATAPQIAGGGTVIHMDVTINTGGAPVDAASGEDFGRGLGKGVAEVLDKREARIEAKIAS